MRDPDYANYSFCGMGGCLVGSVVAREKRQEGFGVGGCPLGTRQWIAREQPASARRVAWSPDGALLASAGNDGSVSVWNASDGMLFKQLRGHQSKVNDVAWSRDGKWLASGGGSRDNEELFVWDMRSLE